MRMIKLASAVLSLASFTPFTHADVRLPAIIGDNMVLQRDQKVTIWGWADPGEKVTVTTLGEKAEATAGADGKWSVALNALKASEQPIEMTVAGKNTISVKNVLVGDVWVASGQSNMEWSFQMTNHAKDELPKSDNPMIRLFIVPKKVAFDPQADCAPGAKWMMCTPADLPRFSAVGYWFAKDIAVTQKVPVGMIGTYWGGTPAQSWASVEALDAEPATKGYADAFRSTKENLPQLMEKYKSESLAKWEADKAKWDEENNWLKEKTAAWQKEADAAKADGKPMPPKPAASRPEPRRPGAPDNNSHMPSGLYNGMIAPILPFAIKGAIWYQGESNAGASKQYQKLFPVMINDWRARWGQGQFPFLWVQLANYMKRRDEPTESAGGWAGLREAQSMTLRLPATGQAVIIDIGEEKDIHPRDKMNVGKRLALSARAVAYGEKELVYSGPVYDSMKVEGDKVRLTFKHTGGGLAIAAAPSTRPSVEPEAALPNLVGFAIAGEDRKWVWADAKIDGDTIVVSSPKVTEPKAVRYAWSDNPACNLYNKEGLPASPFRTDDWQDPPKPAEKK